MEGSRTCADGGSRTHRRRACLLLLRLPPQTEPLLRTQFRKPGLCTAAGCRACAPGTQESDGPSGKRSLQAMTSSACTVSPSSPLDSNMRSIASISGLACAAAGRPAHAAIPLQCWKSDVTALACVWHEIADGPEKPSTVMTTECFSNTWMVPLPVCLLYAVSPLCCGRRAFTARTSLHATSTTNLGITDQSEFKLMRSCLPIRSSELRAQGCMQRDVFGK
jgi:hypothetical protein